MTVTGTLPSTEASIHRGRPNGCARWISWVAVTAVCFLVTACGGTVDQPDIKLNPNARMRYEITVTLKNPPGPFERIDGVVDYRVEDPSRVPEAPFSGAALYPQKQVTIHLTRVADNVFKGDMYIDRLLDADYYGKGVCHWAVQGASVELLGRPVTFMASLDRDEITAQKTTHTFFARSLYNNTSAMRDAGASSATDFKHPGDTFSLEVSSTEVTR